MSAGGLLAGLNTSALIPGVSAAVPATTLHRVATALLAHGHVHRGYLGVSTQRVRLPRALRKELGQKTGLLVIDVEADSTGFSRTSSYR